MIYMEGEEGGRGRGGGVWAFSSCAQRPLLAHNVLLLRTTATVDGPLLFSVLRYTSWLKDVVVTQSVGP